MRHIIRIWIVVGIVRDYAPIWKRQQKKMEIARRLDEQGWKHELNDETFAQMIKSMAASENATDYSDAKAKKRAVIEIYMQRKLWFWRPRKRETERYVIHENYVKDAIKSAVSTEYNLLYEEPQEKYYDDLLALKEDGKKFGVIKMLGLIIKEAGDFIDGMTKLKHFFTGLVSGSILTLIIQIPL
jgi:hypothetical protein